MSQKGMYNSIERISCIDAGKDFIIPQYINFFLYALEELIDESLRDCRQMQDVMKPFNEGYMLLVEYLKLKLFSRRHVSKIIEKFNEGYMTVMNPELSWEKERFSFFSRDAHVIISKICHLVRYEQRYASHTHDCYSMVAMYSLEEIISSTRLNIDETTCKSKELPEFNCGHIYVKGCRRIIHDIHLAVVSLCREESSITVRHLVLRIIKLYTIICRLKNMVGHIEVTKKIPRLYIRREIEIMQNAFREFESAFFKLFSQQQSCDNAFTYTVKTTAEFTTKTTVVANKTDNKISNLSVTYSDKTALAIKNLAVNLVSLRWGLYFLTLTYGSGYINQFGELVIRDKSTDKATGILNKISSTQTSCTIS